MKKVGLFTFYRADNLGALLQSYATVKYLNRYCEAEVIDYVPNNLVPNRNRIVHRILHVFKLAFIFLFSRHAWNRRVKLNKFRKSIPHSNKVYWGDKGVINSSLEYEYLISGSDQILNTELTGNSIAFYLPFDERYKKISYASSFGRENIPAKEMEYIRKYLSNFEYISARELSGSKIIESALDKKIPVVLDPVFLLDQQEWYDLCTAQSDKRYIFVYAMECTNQIKQISRKLSEKYHLSVKVVLGSGGEWDNFGELISDCGPTDFLSLLSGAEYVVTNSFHGLAFSIIFEKKFYVISHSNRNTRIESLLYFSNCVDRMIGFSQMPEDIISYETDGKAALEYLRRRIKESKEYLLCSLDL